MKKATSLFRIFVISVISIAAGFFLFSNNKASAATVQAGIFDHDGNVLQAFSGIKTGSSIAIGDTEGDSENEVVVGSAPGSRSEVTIFRLNGTKIRSFEVFGGNLYSGLNVAIGAPTGYENEIIVAPRRGSGPHVLRFSATGHLLNPGFIAYEAHFRGGVTLATGDINGDGKDEIITGAGPGGGAHVSCFDADGNRVCNLFPYEDSFRGGVAVAAIDYDDNGSDEIVTTPQSQHTVDVKVINPRNREELQSFRAFGEFKGGASISVNNSGGGKRVILAAGFGGGPHVQQYNLETKKIDGLNIFPFPTDYRFGITASFVAYDSGVQFFASPGSLFQSRMIDREGKVILVDLSEQRLYAFDNGYQANTFLVSTGLPGMDTRKGEFRVGQKQYSKLYAGPGFYLPNTLWNMRFDGPRFLHGAYWHNNFGHRMSHGCVNIAYPNAEWLYNWTPSGTLVIVQE